MVKGLRTLFAQLVIGAGMLGIAIPAAAETTARLERDAIDLGETVRLVINSDVPDQNVVPDLSVLAGTFEVLGTSSSQNISVINGTQQISRQWTVELEPGSAGSFTIPAIRVGPESTNLLRLTVSQPTGDPSSGNRDIFVEIDTGLDSAYVQQMIPVTVRLFLGVDILDGSLTDPAPLNADVIRIGNDARYSKTLGNRPFRVVERQYAIFAQASGELIIPPVHFQGVVADASGSSQTFGGLFNQGRRVRAISDQTLLQIAPPNPGNAGRNWLPATNIEINELQPTGGSLAVGEPFTRQIVVSGTGIRAEQLPDLTFTDVPDLRQYPDKVSRENRFTQRTLTGIMGQGVALIPGKAGTVTVPEITIPWWDVVNDEQKVAVLPGWTMEVVPDGTASETDISQTPETPPVTRVDKEALTSTESGARFWKWSSIILGALWILTISILTVRHLAVRKALPGDVEGDKLSQAQILENLHKACRQNNAADAYNAMHEWVRQQTVPGESPSILDWADRAAKSDLTHAVRELENHLFSATATDGQERLWSGTALQKCLPDVANLAARKEGTPNPVIADLYPAVEGR